uniref:C2H2-type domain-containing protein n=1 Tax=Ditylenchus dipsaci TaxID=166011 RepID=A0A915ERL2_9BILA
MFQCAECYLNAQKYYSTLDELEIHLAIDHYKLIIYECFLCPYAKFPTESTLVDHYRYTHSITSAMKINYTLDPSTIEIRHEFNAVLVKVLLLVSLSFSLESNEQNSVLPTSCEFTATQQTIERKYLTDACPDSSDIDDTNSTTLLKTSQYSTIRSKFATMAERYSNLLSDSCATDKNKELVVSQMLVPKPRRSSRYIFVLLLI